MFLVRLQLIDPLVEATSRLAEIAKEVDVKFTAVKFCIIASNRSLGFVATLQISDRFFATYSIDQDHTSRISLEPFHDAMLDGVTFSSMTIHLLENIHQMLLLRFESDNNLPQLRNELILSPSREKELEDIEYEKYFMIDSLILRHVIKDLPLFQEDSVSVTVTASQVKFSIASREIIVTKKGGLCKIIGYEEEDETTFQIILLPRLFFLNFTYEADWIWFYTTVLCHGVMSVPTFGFYAQYVIYFTRT